MSLPDSERLRTKLDALSWRLREASDDLVRKRQEAAEAAKSLQDARVASLLGEEDPTVIPAKSARSETAESILADEESLVRRLEQSRSEAQRDYQQALRREWGAQLLRRWRQLMTEGEGGAGDAAGEGSASRA
ncbi:MAG TPA: hypothetical protein VFJ58_05020 [Armatimonadota bacterium]|nr:hypothetical protein [Armatimonadota bacterium]